MLKNRPDSSAFEGYIFFDIPPMQNLYFTKRKKNVKILTKIGDSGEQEK